MNWKLLIIAALILVILYMSLGKKQSGFSDVRSKLTTEKCPSGFRELGPTICVKD